MAVERIIGNIDTGKVALEKTDRNMVLLEGSINADVAALVAHKADKASCLAIGSIAQSITNAQVTLVNLASVVDNDSLLLNNQLIIKKAGIYLITFTAYFASNSSGLRVFYLYINGGIKAQSSIPAIASLGVGQSIAQMFNLQIGDVVEFKVFQNCGSALNLGAEPPAIASIVKVG